MFYLKLQEISSVTWFPETKFPPLETDPWTSVAKVEILPQKIMSLKMSPTFGTKCLTVQVMDHGPEEVLTHEPSQEKLHSIMMWVIFLRAIPDAYLNEYPHQHKTRSDNCCPILQLVLADVLYSWCSWNLEAAEPSVIVL